MAGSKLPNKTLMKRESKAALENTACQIGILIAVERNRRGLTQDELANLVGTTQTNISFIETGKAVPVSMTDAQIDRVFTSLGMRVSKKAGSTDFAVQSDFLKWWRLELRNM